MHDNFAKTHIEQACSMSQYASKTYLENMWFAQVRSEKLSTNIPLNFVHLNAQSAYDSLIQFPNRYPC